MAAPGQLSRPIPADRMSKAAPDHEGINGRYFRPIDKIVCNPLNGGKPCG
jgi:hypothetical protein